MRRTIHGALIILVSLSTAAVRSAAQSAAQSSVAPTPPSADVRKGDARKGATEFNDCVNCHGRNGDGGFGPNLAGTGLPWIAFRKSVREPWGLMPAFREQLKPDQALADIYAYLQT